MKRQLLLIITFCVTSSALAQSQWTEEKRDLYLANRQNPATWDMELLEEDKQLNQIPTSFIGCMKIGAFPVSDYQSIDGHPFNGLGFVTSTYEPFLLEDKKVVYTAFGTNGVKENVFFNLVTVTDTIDNEQYTTARATALSRNHPDYLGQGFIKTRSSQMDFIAFTTAEGHAFAIVNSRIFDLSYGSTLVITPQKDGTFRSLQVQSEKQTLNTIERYVKDELLKKQDVVSFLTEAGVI